MRPLLIGPGEHAAIAKVVAHAEANRFNLHDLMAILKGTRRPPGDDPAFVCHLPVGFRCVFSIDQQPIGWCRHLSVSVNAPGAWPNENAVSFLAHEFGFRHTLKDKKWMIQLEESVRAVNVLEKLEDDP